MENTKAKSLLSNGLLTLSVVIAAFLVVPILQASQNKQTAVANTDYIEVQGATTSESSYKNSAPDQTPQSVEVPAVSQPTSPITFDQLDSVTILVNKKHPLPSSYVPSGLTDLGLEGADDAQLTEESAMQLRKLFDAAAAVGLPLRISSAYRSYDEQAVVYNSFVTGYSREYADTTSARPSYSEHQTGLAVDVATSDGTCELDSCFADTAAGKWLASNAHLYGFSIRYMKDKEASTGYDFEPWHLRYFGVGLASQLHASGQTYEEFLGVDGGDYTN